MFAQSNQWKKLIGQPYFYNRRPFGLESDISELDKLKGHTIDKGKIKHFTEGEIYDDPDFEFERPTRGPIYGKATGFKPHEIGPVGPKSRKPREPDEPSETPKEPSETPKEPSETPKEPSETPKEPSETPGVGLRIKDILDNKELLKNIVEVLTTLVFGYTTSQAYRLGGNSTLAESRQNLFDRISQQFRSARTDPINMRLLSEEIEEPLQESPEEIERLNNIRNIVDNISENTRVDEITNIFEYAKDVYNKEGEPIKEQEVDEVLEGYKNIFKNEGSDKEPSEDVKELDKLIDEAKKKVDEAKKKVDKEEAMEHGKEEKEKEEIEKEEKEKEEIEKEKEEITEGEKILEEKVKVKIKPTNKGLDIIKKDGSVTKIKYGINPKTGRPTSRLIITPEGTVIKNDHYSLEFKEMMEKITGIKTIERLTEEQRFKINKLTERRKQLEKDLEKDLEKRKEKEEERKEKEERKRRKKERKEKIAKDKARMRRGKI